MNESNEIATVTTSVPADSPDLSGIWQTMNTAHWNLEGHTAKKMPVTGLIGAYGGMLAGTSVVDKGEIPYRPEALLQRDANREDWTNLDPAARCFIPGIPSQPYMPAPYKMLQTDTEIFIAYEWGSNSRSIFMNRSGTSAPLPSWMGYSLGRWEGDTLVVRTTNFKEETGLYCGDENLYLTERFTPLENGNLLYDFTVKDDTARTAPWSGAYVWKRDDAKVYEYACHEGNYGMINILRGERVNELRELEASP